MAATLAHPLRGVLTTDPGTTRATDRLADAVLRAVEDDLARPNRDSGPARHIESASSSQS
jgi:hypothetical protein